MNFAFSNLLGAPYRGGNLVLDGRELLSAVGNRVSQVGRVRAGKSINLQANCCTDRSGIADGSDKQLNHHLSFRVFQAGKPS